MRTAATLAISLFLALTGASPILAAETPAPADVTAPTDVASQTRAKWTQTRAAYLTAVAPYVNDKKYAPLVKQYTDALDKAGASLERFLTVKQASPATQANELTPAVDQLIKDLTALRTLRGKAKGPLVNVLGTALTEHNDVAQAALKNMR